MHGLIAKSSVTPLNIFGLLMRYSRIFHRDQSVKVWRKKIWIGEVIHHWLKVATKIEYKNHKCWIILSKIPLDLPCSNSPVFPFPLPSLPVCAIYSTFLKIEYDTYNKEMSFKCSAVILPSFFKKKLWIYLKKKKNQNQNCTLLEFTLYQLYCIKK